MRSGESPSAGGPASVRRRVDRGIARFSALIGVVVLVLVATAWAIPCFPAVREAKRVNALALSDVFCRGDACDSTQLSTRWDAAAPDYIIDSDTGYFILAPDLVASEGYRTAVDYCETEFIRRFRNPSSWTTPDGERWRLYSRETMKEGRRLEIMVGYVVQAPWSPIETPESQLPVVDEALRKDAEVIAAALHGPKEPERSRRTGLRADGFVVVDAEAERIIESSLLPMFLPRSTPLPSPGIQIDLGGGAVYLWVVTRNNRLWAISLLEVGPVWAIVASLGAAFVIGTWATYAGVSRFFRDRFIIAANPYPNLAEALRAGEGVSIEFKRALRGEADRLSTTDEDLLRTVAAFANTEGGVIFVGVDDSGHVKGLQMEKDRFERKIHELVRNHVRPRPPVRVEFEEIRGALVGKIIVARGEAPVYMLRGTIYVRDGSSDIQAQPEDVQRLLLRYAV